MNPFEVYSVWSLCDKLNDSQTPRINSVQSVKTTIKLNENRIQTVLLTSPVDHNLAQVGQKEDHTNLT